MNKKVKLLITIISCYQDKVQTYLENNYEYYKSKKYSIEFLINWNNVEEVPKFEYKDLIIHNRRTLDVFPNYPDKTESNWNKSRFTNTLDFDYDYLLLQDDDVIHNSSSIDNLIDEAELVGMDGLTVLLARDLRPYKTYNIEEELNNLSKTYKIKHKSKKFTGRYSGSQGGHLISRDFLNNNYDKLIKYNGHGEDCYRQSIAMLENKFYYTQGKVTIMYYDYKGYSKELQFKSAIDAAKVIDLPVYFRISPSVCWYPIFKNDLLSSDYIEVSDNLYVPDELTKNKIIKLYGEQLK